MSGGPLWCQGTVVDDEVLVVGVRQGWAEAVAVVLVGAAVGTQGGKQVCVGDAVPLGVDVGEPVLVGDGIGTQVVAGVDFVGCGSPPGVVVGTCVTAGTDVAGVWGMSPGLGAVVLAGVAPGRAAAGLPASVVCFVAAAELRDAAVVGTAGATSEAGRALTPWRYASAMAITMLT